jgi:excisionase family DNA binding protein
MLTVMEVSEQLGLHVKTVRRHIAEGRIKAVRIGKHYRIPTASLAALTSVAPEPKLGPLAQPAVGMKRFSEVSSVIQIEAIGRDDAQRVINGIGGAVKGRDKHNDGPLRVDSVYDEVRARLKIIVTGSLATTRILLDLISGYTQ